MERDTAIVLVRHYKQVIPWLSLIKYRLTITALRSLCRQELYFLGTRAMGLRIA